MTTVDWDKNLLESFIEDRGDVVIHEIAVMCPACNNHDPYASTVNNLHGRQAWVNNFDCGKCQGDRFLYRNARMIRGLVTGIQPAQRDLMDAGLISPGDAMFSPSMDVGHIGNFDRITLTTSAGIDGGQTIMRGAAHLHTNSAVESGLTPEQDRLWYLPDVCCGSVIWCEDANGVTYTYGQDFFFEEKKIVWVNGPDQGVLYTIKYQAFLEFVAYTAPMERYDRGRSLGQKVILRKKHVHFLSRTTGETPSARSDEQLMVNKPAKL